MKKSKQLKPGVILGVGAIFQLFLGIIYVWSVFVAPVSEYFNWEIASVKLTSSFMLCFFVVGILVGGRIQGKLTTQKCSLLGGVLMSLGMIASAFLPVSMGMVIYVTYGIVGGFGVGLSYNAIITTAQRNFPEKRGLATGISVCAFGFSTVIFAPLVKYLVEKIALNNTFLLLGVVFFIVTILCFSFIRMPEMTGKGQMDFGDQKQYTTGEMLKTKQFYFITLSLMLGTSVYFILNPSFITLANERDSANIATMIVMVAGIANAIGRLAVPLMSDKIGQKTTVFGIITLTAVSSFCLIFASGVFLLFVIAVIAFCYGGYSGVYPVITGHYFGLKNIGSNYGAVMVGFAMSALFMPMLLGVIQDQTMKFIVLGVVAGIGTVLITLLKKD